MCFVKKKKKRKKKWKRTCVDLFHFRLFQTISVITVNLVKTLMDNNTDKIIGLYYFSNHALYIYNPIKF